MSGNTWKNWAETVICHPSEIVKPSSEDEITSIIAKAKKEGKRIRVVGNGHSFTALNNTSSILMSLENWQGVLDLDKEKSCVTVRSGTQIKALGELLHQEGLAQENLGDIDVQSIAGAISTGTHGTGVELGNLSTQVEELTFINGNGELISCSEEENHDIFKAAQISLGALGIITRIKLRCVPAYKLELQNVKGSLKECLAHLESYKKENRNFEFYYFPYTDVVQMKFSNITDNDPERGGLMQYLNDIILENGAFKVVSEISRIFPSQSRRVSRLCGSLVGESKRSTWSHQVYATARLVKFTEMEYNIPSVHYTDCMNEIIRKIEKEQYDLHFPIENRFVKGDDIWLSPAYQRDSAYVAVHMYKGMPFEKYLRDMEEIFDHYQGRPHWGKLHYKSPEKLAELYPEWNAFHAIRRKMDADGIFMNDYLASIFGERVPILA